MSFTFILIGLVSLLLNDKGDIVLWFNGIQSESLDNLFLYVTKLGELIGGVLTFLLLLFFAPTRKYLLVFIVSVSITTAFAQGFKKTVYKSEKRPAYSFEDLKQIDGLDRHKENSFPSGHTTAAFTFITLLTLGLKRKKIEWVLPFIAVFIGISRVYLGQHYLNDIVAGAVLGLLITSVVHLIFVKRNWLDDYEKLV